MWHNYRSQFETRVPNLDTSREPFLVSGRFASLAAPTRTRLAPDREKIWWSAPWALFASDLVFSTAGH